MPDARLTRLTLCEAADLLERRALSPVELCRAALERIARIDPTLNTYTTLVPEDVVLAEARRAEREIADGHRRGPLHGVPVGVKDLIDTAGLRTTYGSGMFRDHVPSRDGAMPARVRAAGGILLGKTATHEFGMGITTNNYFFGPTLNPWHQGHVPGGSSGGAGAATAAELGTWQIGTDGGGSVRIPASFCGVVGLKPTLGLLSNRGQFGNGNVSFSVPGPMARCVLDTVVAAQVLAGFDPDYAYARPGPQPDLLAGLERGVRGLRLGTAPELLVPEPDPAVRSAYAATLRRLETLGACVEEVRLPHHELLAPVALAVFGIEGGTQTRELMGERPRVLSPQVARAMAQVPGDATSWAKSLHDRQWMAHDYAAAFARVDALVTPTVPCAAPRIDDDEAANVLRVVPYTAAVNMVGLPAVSIPMGDDAGLPLGVQIIGPHGADAVVLRVAWALEQDAPEHRVATPPTFAD